MNMKAEFINPFLDATMTVLRTMTSVEPIPGKPWRPWKCHLPGP